MIAVRYWRVHAALSAGAALLAVAGCADGDPASVTTVVFDGETYTINGQVSCAWQPDGKLLINAPSRASGLGGKKLVRVLLAEDYRIVVTSAGFRHLDIRGFTDNPDEMWASKADNTYTVRGRMPPGDGEITGHQFSIAVTCPTIEKSTRSPQFPPMMPLP